MTDESVPNPDRLDIDELKDIFLFDKSDIPRMILMISKRPEEERKMKMEHIRIALEELGIPFPTEEALQAFSRISDN